MFVCARLTTLSKVCTRHATQSFIHTGAFNNTSWTWYIGRGVAGHGWSNRDVTGQSWVTGVWQDSGGDMMWG